MIKICNKCNKELPNTSEYFHKSKECKDGLRGYCKKCQFEHNKIYNEKNKELRKKLRRNRYEKHKEEEKQYCKDYSEKNKEYLINYRKENVARKRIVNQKHRSKKHNLKATLTIKEWETIKLYFNNKCCYCERDLPLEVEHFVPIKSGGEYTKYNILPACKSCNVSKRSKTFEEWYINYKYYSKEREEKILNYLKIIEES